MGASANEQEGELADPFVGEIIELTTKEDSSVKPLSIGAGGSIEQHIERDRNDPRMWDVANSKIFNIQLIDARTFKLVTGLDWTHHQRQLRQRCIRGWVYLSITNGVRKARIMELLGHHGAV